MAFSGGVPADVGLDTASAVSDDYDAASSIFTGRPTERARVLA
jgi:hypothetical protein